jgi:3'-phosphoadenosine 5'-phosphosulfate (PAPS) 3'-phosphatase
MYCLDQNQVDSLLADVRSAGAACLEIYRQDDFGIQIKSDNSPVTKADLKVNEILTAALQKLTPDIPIISEEANIPYDERKNYDIFWILDPIDGTKEFIKKSGEFTLNIGLVENKKPIFGIIYIPVLDEMFWGGQISNNWTSTGVETADYPPRKAFISRLTFDNHISSIRIMEKEKEEAVCKQDFEKASNLRDRICKAKEEMSRGGASGLLEPNQRPIRARSLENTRFRPMNAGPADYLIDITCSKDHRHPNDWKFIEKISQDHHIKLIPCGSTIKICRIAEGEADLYLRMSGINDWDLAAGHAIVEAAGGHITTLDGRELVYNTEKQKLEPFLVCGAQQLDWTKWAPDENS